MVFYANLVYERGDLKFSHNPRGGHLDQAVSHAAPMMSNIRAVGQQGETWGYPKNGFVTLSA